MKKVILFFAVAFFLSAGVVTATKMQSASVDATELIASADADNMASPFLDDDEKKKKSKKDAKAAKVETDKDGKACKEKCPSEKGAKKCCDKSAKKSCDKDKK